MSSVPSVPSAVANADGDASVTAFFYVQARAEPGVMPRVLELFAKRGLVPRRWHGATAGSADAALTIDIECSGLGCGTVDYVARCIRQIVGVDTVLTVMAGTAAVPLG